MKLFEDFEKQNINEVDKIGDSYTIMTNERFKLEDIRTYASEIMKNRQICKESASFLLEFLDLDQDCPEKVIADGI